MTSDGSVPWVAGELDPQRDTAGFPEDEIDEDIRREVAWLSRIGDEITWSLWIRRLSVFVLAAATLIALLILFGGLAGQGSTRGSYWASSGSMWAIRSAWAASIWFGSLPLVAILWGVSAVIRLLGLQAEIAVLNGLASAEHHDLEGTD